MAILACTNCSSSHDSDSFVQRCEICNEALEVVLDLAGAETCSADGHSLLGKYENILPPVQGRRNLLTLWEGNTPLIRPSRLERALGLDRLYIKDESRNPTGSFKDRGTVVALSHAASLGLERVGTVSTGNMAASVAAYSACAGLDCHILVSATINPWKLRPIAVYGPHIISVDGDYGELYFRSLEIGREMGIYFANGDDPYRVEGQKTIAYEIWEGFNRSMPEYVFLPISSGGLFSAILKAIKELRSVNLLSSTPTIIGVQAEGASPIARAYIQGRAHIDRFSNPRTIAHAISNPFPPSGNRVLRQLRKYGNGRIITVNDEEILEARDLLAKNEGLFVQPAAAAPLAGVIKLAGQGSLMKERSIVCVVTGSGLKDLSVFDERPPDVQKSTLERLHETIAMQL